MKTFARNAKNLIQFQKKNFASGGGHKVIDPNLKDFDVAFIGGLNGASVVNFLQKQEFHGDVAIFNDNTQFYNQHHYEYLVQGNMQSYKYLAASISLNFDNKESLHVPQRIVDIKPEKNQMVDNKGTVYTYKTLVLNTGLQQVVADMDFVKQWVQDGDFANSRVFIHQPGNFDHLERNRRIFGMHKGNDFIVYLPKYPSRREAYDGWYLGLDTFLSWGWHSQTMPTNMKIRVITPNNELYRFPFANEVVMDEIKDRQLIECHFGWEITNIELVNKINHTERYATFKNTKTGEEMRLNFGTILLTPNNKKRSCYESNDLTDESGQVKVNKYSLQHVKYPNVFAFGDCTDVPTTKSLYATYNQSAVLKSNLLDYLEGRDFKGVYEGYSSYAVNHSMDRQWIFSHKYNFTPSFGNFYVPRFLGLFVYKFKNMLEKQFFSKAQNSKPNFGYPWIKKGRYFRPINENKYVAKNNITRKDLMPHGDNKPLALAHDSHHH